MTACVRNCSFLCTAVLGEEVCDQDAGVIMVQNVAKHAVGGSGADVWHAKAWDGESRLRDRLLEAWWSTTVGLLGDHYLQRREHAM